MSGSGQATQSSVPARENAKMNSGETSKSTTTTQEELNIPQIDPGDLTIQKGSIYKGLISKVYQGTYCSNPVSVKIFPEHAEQDFRDEAIILSELKHENIAELVGVCKSEGNYMIVTKFLQGGTLKELLESCRWGSKTLPLPQAIGYALDIARAMDYIHQNKYIHRDLKPENVFLTENKDQAVLIDFGNSIMKDVTGMPGDAGTPLWMAPEMMSNKDGRAHYDHTVDVFSFSILLWELLTCKFPYQEQPISMDEILEGIRTHEIRPSMKDVKIPEKLDTLLKSCWAADPADRPEFSEISATLEELVQTFNPEHTTAQTAAANEQVEEVTAESEGTRVCADLMAQNILFDDKQIIEYLVRPKIGYQKLNSVATSIPEVHIYKYSPCQLNGSSKQNEENPCSWFCYRREQPSEEKSKKLDRVVAVPNGVWKLWEVVNICDDVGNTIGKKRILHFHKLDEGQVEPTRFDLYSMAEYIIHPFYELVPVNRYILCNVFRYLPRNPSPCNVELLVTHLSRRARNEPALLPIYEICLGNERLSDLISGPSPFENEERVYFIGPAIDWDIYKMRDGYWERLGCDSIQQENGEVIGKRNIYIFMETKDEIQYQRQEVSSSPTGWRMDVLQPLSNDEQYMVARIYMRFPPGFEKREPAEIGVMKQALVDLPEVEEPGNLFCLVCQNTEEGTFKSIACPQRHIFHEKCICQWLLKIATCPHCRSLIAPTCSFHSF